MIDLTEWNSTCHDEWQLVTDILPPPNITVEASYHDPRSADSEYIWKVQMYPSGSWYYQNLNIGLRLMGWVPVSWRLRT